MSRVITLLWQMQKQGPERPRKWPKVTQQKVAEPKSQSGVHSLDSLEPVATLLPVYRDLGIPLHPKPSQETGGGVLHYLTRSTHFWGTKLPKEKKHTETLTQSSHSRVSTHTNTQTDTFT